MRGQAFFGSFGQQLSESIQLILDNSLGAGSARPLLWQITLADLISAGVIILSFLLLLFLLSAWTRSYGARQKERGGEESWAYQMVLALSRPIYAIFMLFCLRLALVPLVEKSSYGSDARRVDALISILTNIIVFGIILWLFIRLTHVLRIRLQAWARTSESPTDDLIIPPIIRTLQIALPLLAIMLGLPVLGLSEDFDQVFGKLTSLTLIAVVAWVLIQGVRIGQAVLLSKYNVKAADNLEARKMHTQMRVLSKTLYVLIIILAGGSMLMVFEEARRFGANILASAGVVGVILGFAAQKTIANLFAGFQIAMTQPIRIDDVVIVEGEWGRVEEITLTYVVIAIWDQRRLIVPLSHFIDKPFQNWTRVSAEIIGIITFWADYSVPVGEIREEAKRLIESHPKWDKRAWNLQVTEVTDRAIQLRVIVTAANSGDAWDMRCEVRERLIDFLQKRPGSLPKVRAELSQDK